jgi:small subunit ribosomal protein S6
MVRDYEVVYIFDSSLEESVINERLDRLHGVLTSGDGSEVTEVDHWGKQQLAYPIQDHENGYYVVAHVTAATDALPEFERLLKLDESVLRHLVVVNEGDLSTSPIALDERGDDEDGDDDEEED